MTDLTQEELQLLVEENLIQPHSQPTKRKVSGTLLTPPQSGGESSSSAATSICYRSHSPNIPQWFDMPVSIESAAALEHIGFTANAAHEIYERFLGRPDGIDNPDSLLDYAFGHLYRPNPPTDAGQFMNMVGISTSMQYAILDPKYEQIFQTENVLFWIKDTLRMNYHTLIKLNEKLKAHAKQSLGKKKKRAKVQGLFMREEPAESSPTVTTTLSGPLQYEGQSVSMSQISTTVDHAPPIPPDCQVLYKGKSPAEMVEEDLFRANGNIDMGAIESAKGGDFNAKSAAWHFSPEHETAELYRGFAARRCGWSETWIIRILVPHTFLETLRKEHLYYGRDWKEFVWLSRKNIPDFPSKFSNLTSAELIIGHISKSLDNMIRRIKQSDVQEKINEGHVMTITGGKSTQWAFTKEDAANRLGREIKGKIHIDVYAPLGKQE